MPVCVLGEGGGLCLGRATATAWWRPAGCSGRRGTAGEHQRDQRRAVGRLRGDACAPARSKRGPGWLSTAPAMALHSGGGENRGKELEEGEKDLNKISEISRDQTVKQR